MSAGRAAPGANAAVSFNRHYSGEHRETRCIFSPNDIYNSLDKHQKHEHISTTQKYTHLSDPYIEDSLSRYWDKSILIGGGNDGK